MKIYITRHGETIWNKEDRLQGWLNSDLTEKGIEDAKKLGFRLKNIDFDHIYSSPQNRAMETANYIRGSKNTKITPLDTLKEIGLGKWEGLKKAEIEISYPEEYYNFWNKPDIYKPVGGESFKELFTRIEESLKIIIGSKEEKDILIVSHGIAIKALYCILKKKTLKEFWYTSYMDNNSLTIIEIKNEEFDFLLDNDITHLI